MSQATRKCVGNEFVSFRKIPTVIGELGYTTHGTKYTEEEGRLANFLRDTFKEVLGECLGSLLSLVQTVLFGVSTPSPQGPERKQHSPPWGPTTR